MTRRRKPAEQPSLIDAAVNRGGPDTVTGETLHGPVFSPPDLGASSQLDRANALARDRDEGEREGHIAGMAEAAAIAVARAAADRAEDNAQWACATERVADECIDELRRRYGADDPRVLHHLRLRGLQ